MSMDLAKHRLEAKTTFCERQDLVCDKQENVNVILGKYLTAEALVICWQVHRIVWGRYSDHQLTLSDGSTLEPHLLLELRAFNDGEELHLIKKGCSFVGRYVIDKANGAESVDYVDSFARFWGETETLTEDKSYAIVSDKGRKLSMTIPVKEQASWYGLTTRSYIGYLEANGQASYVDYRYVSIAPAEGGK